MSRGSLRVGSALLILGFMTFSFGLLITLHQTIIINEIVGFIPDLGVVEVIGLLLQIFGAFLASAGLLVSLSRIVSIILEDERRNLIELTVNTEKILKEFTVNTEKILKELSFQMAKKTQLSETTQKCKYCGAELTEGEVFCPSCGRSQR
jgi:hypothetical protein